MDWCWIARKYRLSPAVFLVLFLLFNFNGNITAHLAVGHTIWTGHFLIPYFILLVLSLLENQGRWAGVGSWVSAWSSWRILLQGYFHLYVWCLMFLGLLALFNWRLIKPVLLGGAFSVLVGLPRLLPPALALSGITQEYLGGFCVSNRPGGWADYLRDPQHTIRLITDTFPLNSWEIDYYIGLLGLAFLVVFGILVPLRRDRSKGSLQVQLLVASLVFTAFSIGDVFSQVVRVFTVPPLTGERVTARMFILPLVFVMVLAAMFFQRELDRLKTEGRRIPAWAQIMLLGILVVLYHDLRQHFQAWRIRYLDAMVELFPKVPFDPAQHTLANHADPIYTNLLLGGLAVALLALAFLVWMALRERRLRPRLLVTPQSGPAGRPG